jgi:hypothetical protein
MEPIFAYLADVAIREHSINFRAFHFIRVRSGNTHSATGELDWMAKAKLMANLM